MKHWGFWKDCDKNTYEVFPKMPTPKILQASVKFYPLECDWDLPVRWDVCYVAVEN